MIKKIRLLICTIAFIYFPIMQLMKEWNNLFSNIFEGILLLIFLIINFNDSKIFLSKNEVLYIVFVTIYFVIGIINDFSSSFSGYRILIFYFLIYRVLRNISKNSKSDYKKIVVIAIIVGVIVAIGSIVQYYYPSVIQNLHSPTAYPLLRRKTNFMPKNEYNRSISCMDDPNLLGVYLFFCFAVLYTSHIKYKLPYSIIFFLGIIFTRSRTSYVLLALFIILRCITAIAYGKLNIKKVVAISLIVISLLFYISNNLDVFFSFVRIETLSGANNRMAHNETNIDRLLVNQNLINVVLGNGLTNGRGIELTFENIIILLLYMFGYFSIIFVVIVISLLYKDLNVKNIGILMCYILSLFAGDYLLIPQITILFILNYIQCGENI